MHNDIGIFSNQGSAEFSADAKIMICEKVPKKVLLFFDNKVSLH